MIRSDSIGEIMIRSAGRKDRDSDENPRWYTVQKQAMTKTKNRQQKKAHHHKGSILLHISHKPLSFSHLALNAPLIRFMIPLIPSPRLLLYTHSLHTAPSTILIHIRKPHLRCKPFRLLYTYGLTLKQNPGWVEKIARCKNKAFNI